VLPVGAQSVSAVVTADQPTGFATVTGVNVQQIIVAANAFSSGVATVRGVPSKAKSSQTLRDGPRPRHGLLMGEEDLAEFADMMPMIIEHIATESGFYARR
jgi:hypothetical protein